MTRYYSLVNIVTALVMLCLPDEAHAQKLVFVTRHAERADRGSLQMQAQADPALSAAGEARAAKLAEMLRDAGITAIYATEFRRTQETARPLATKLGFAARSLPSRETNALISSLRGEHANQIVLVVGHSNTVPVIIKALGGPDVTIAESEYDSLFIIVPGTGTMTRIRFTP